MLKQVLELFDLLDRPDASAGAVRDYLTESGSCTVEIEQASSPQGSTEFIRVRVPGREGSSAGGDCPTMGIIGRLGGIGARPEVTGFVSDGDGALAALAAAAKLARMNRLGDTLPGDVLICTHICPDAPTRAHHPVPFMASPVPQDRVNASEVRPEMQAILSIDTTKGNRVINHRGFAISPTVREGYILRTSEDLLDIMSRVTGRPPRVFALSQQDITPYANQVFHINSILQPCTVTDAPVVGVAITAETSVAGCASGATQPVDVEATARFAVEVAKAFTAGTCSFHDAEEYDRLIALYGDQRRFQTPGSTA